MEKYPKCGKCGKRYQKGKGSLSRRDNKTDICAECGYKEAMEDLQKIIEMNRRK